MKKYSAYISFCMKNRKFVMSEFPTMKPKDVTKELAIRWNKLSIEEKNVYKMEIKENKNYKNKDEKDKNIDSGDKNKTQNIVVWLMGAFFFFIFFMNTFYFYIYNNDKKYLSSLTLPNPYTGINEKNVHPLAEILSRIRGQV